MNCNLQRIDENKYYILYKLELDKKDVSPRYLIYRTYAYGGDFLRSFRYLAEARKIFKIETRQMVVYENGSKGWL